MTKRLRFVAGGTSASKTISILLLYIDTVQTDTEASINSVTAESIPHLRKGAMRDFEDIMKKHNYWAESEWNASTLTYTFSSNGAKIEFFSTDDSGKTRGPRRKRLYMNEGNNQTRTAFDDMEVRTSDEVWVDWNPSSEFWAYDVMKERPEDVEFITLTYLDNEALSKSIVKSIESRKPNKQWWQVYGLGQLGEAEGRIFTGWSIIDQIPHEARLLRRGLDFGYSNDPSTVVDIYYYNGGYIVDEQLYQKGMSNKQLADFLGNLPEPHMKVVADSAEPKSIDEIKSYGINIVPVVKGKDSIKQGIQYVQDQRISITKRSLNMIKEYRNYLWETDKEGKILNTPIDYFNHCMDALRYGFEGLKGKGVSEAVFFTGDAGSYTTVGSRDTGQAVFF